MAGKGKQRMCRICKKRPPWKYKNCPPGVCKQCYHKKVWADRPAARKEREGHALWTRREVTRSSARGYGCGSGASGSAVFPLVTPGPLGHCTECRKPGRSVKWRERGQI